jgi:hypothetical protein
MQSSTVYYLFPSFKTYYASFSSSEIDSLFKAYLPSLNVILNLPSIIFPSSEVHFTNQLNEISNRAISFSIWRERASAPSLQILHTLVNNLNSLPYSIEFYSPDRKLSTAQRRKFLQILDLHPSQSTACLRLCLFLRHNASGPITHISLCEEFSSNAMQPTPPSDQPKTPAVPNIYQDSMISAQSIVTDTFDVNDSAVFTLTLSDQLRTRKSATPLRPSLAALICNLAGIRRGSIVLDPFCGSGSLLSTAFNLGAVCMGADVHLSVPYAQTNKNFDWVTANIYQHTWEMSGRLDAIICDPPYGRRERHVSVNGSETSQCTDSVARAAERFTVLDPLLFLASQALRTGGRLVFLFAK